MRPRGSGRPAVRLNKNRKSVNASRVRCPAPKCGGGRFSVLQFGEDRLSSMAKVAAAYFNLARIAFLSMARIAFACFNLGGSASVANDAAEYFNLAKIAVYVRRLALMRNTI